MSDKELQALARQLAEAANECCSRSDGWEAEIYGKILTVLREVQAAQRGLDLAVFGQCVEKID